MLRLARTLAIGWLALALCAQGAWAATMAFCGPSHPEQAAAADAAHADGPAAGHHADDTVTDRAAASDEIAPSDLHGCSVCASCCSAAAIHDTVPKLPALDAVAADFAAPVAAVWPFTAAGPERPPRLA